MGVVWVLLGEGEFYLERDLELIQKHHPEDRVIIFSETQIGRKEVRNIEFPPVKKSKLKKALKKLKLKKTKIKSLLTHFQSVGNVMKAFENMQQISYQ